MDYMTLPFTLLHKNIVYIALTFEKISDISFVSNASIATFLRTTRLIF